MTLALRNLLTQIRQANISAVPCNQNFFSVLTSPARISRKIAELNQLDIRGASDPPDIDAHSQRLLFLLHNWGL